MPIRLSFNAEGRRTWRRTLLILLTLCFGISSCSPAPSTAPPAQPRQPIAGGPTLLRDDLTLRRVGPAGPTSIRLAVDPTDGALYVLSFGNGLIRIDPTSGVTTPVATIADLVGTGTPSGMAFGPDGTLYLVANRPSGARTKGLVRRGKPADPTNWTTVAETAQYPLSGTNFDHLFNGIVVSPDGAWLFVNSGSRTDHGEVQANSGNFPNSREVPLTSRIFRIPADATNLRLENDEETLAPYVYARGLRNAYDLAFAPNGDLFAVDNGPDADLPDELNWIQEGQHYGFPWRFGDQPNPVTVAGFDPAQDGRLNRDFTAVQQGLYIADANFPPPPMPFTDPILNRGPAATIYRSVDGKEQNGVADAGALQTFTPHRSPLGLLFVPTRGFPNDLLSSNDRQSALILSWGAAGGSLSDKGQDLLHLALTREGDTYGAVTTQIARDFKRPIDAVLVGTKLYLLEFEGEGVIWELTFAS